MSHDIKDILKAEILGEKTKLLEASLGRIMKHVESAKEKGFAILTSWRSANDKKTNNQKFFELKDYVRARGWGFIQMIGHWQECQDKDMKYRDCSPDNLKDSREPSLMILGIDLGTAKMLGLKYDQDSVLYAGPDTEGQAYLYFKDGDVKNLGEFNPMTTGEAYSEYRTKEDKKAKFPRTERYFTFEGFSYPAQSFTEKLIEGVLRKEIKAIIRNNLPKNSK